MEGRMRHAEDCGCHPEQHDGIWYVFYCPTHKAAPEMANFIRRVANHGEDEVLRDTDWVEARALLKRLEG
jgi:hypothetical protein